MLEEAQFVAKIAQEFPEIKDEVLDPDYNGLITLQLGVFRNFAQEAIDKGDINLAKRCFDFLTREIEDVEFSVENAIYLSFLGKINLEATSVGGKLKKMLSPKFQDAIIKLNQYRNEGGNKRVNDFLKDIS